MGAFRVCTWCACLMLFALAAPAGGLVAQDGTATGRVLQAENEEPLVSATVELRDAADSTVVSSLPTGFDGRFRFGGVSTGEYYLRVATLGYEARTTDAFRIEPDVIYEFGDIVLSTQALVLDPITVESERPAVSYEADRTSYAVDAMVGAEGGTIQDALQSVPDLDVDIDGNVEFQGERPAIWIDGRPAPVSGQSLTQFLEQFPSDLIDRVEVIDSPGAEFDAEGPGGIVNIVLKEGVDLGLSGGIFVNADTRGSTGVGGRATMQRGDWVFDGSASVRRSDSESDSYLLRQDLAADSSWIERSSWNENTSLGGNVGLRATYTPRDEARIWVRTNYSARGGERDGLVTTTHMDPTQTPTLRYDRSDLRDTNDASVDLRTGFEWRWEPRRHTFEVELRYNEGGDRRESYEEVATDDDFADFDRVPAELTLDDRDENEREIRFDMDYRRPLGERTSIRTGYSLRQDVEESDRLVSLIDDPDGSGQTEESLLGFDRTQRFNSAYLTLQREVSEQLSVQGGLRAEHVDWTLGSPTAEEITGDYFDVFPSASLSWRFDGSRRVRLSYSQRIGRPGPSNLDPTNRSTDPLERTIGNPDLEPRYTHRVNMNASWSGPLGTVSVGPYVSRAVNGWERITTVDEDGVSTRTWDNLSSQTSTGASLNLRLPRRGGWRGSVSVSGSRTERDADNLDARFSGTSTRWNSRLNLNGPIVGDLTGQARIRYRAAGRSVQGRDGAQANVDLSFRYRFMQNRASASLSLRDPFGLQESESHIEDPTVWEFRRSSQRSRSAQLSISYSLGGGGSRGGGPPGRGPRN